MRTPSFAPAVMLPAALTLTLSAAAQTAPALTTLHSFSGGGGDGAYPTAGLTAGPNGTFYGTTKRGGAYGLGSIYQLTPPTAGGAWREKVIYNFAGIAQHDGSSPY